MSSVEGQKTLENHDSLRTLLREIILGFVFWSLFQGLAPMIWFFPLNELEISGYEAFAVVWFSPILLGIPGALRVVQNRWCLGILRMLTVASLGSFQASSTEQRLIILALGNGTAILILTANLWSPCRRIRSASFWGLYLGLLLFISSRIWLTSFVPTWWSKDTNTAVITIVAIAVIDHIFTGSDSCQEENPSKIKDQPPWLAVSVGFGSLLFLTQNCFGEVSLVTRWVVKSYPDIGPQPYPWGAVILLCLSFGIYMSSCHHMSSSKIWWMMGFGAFLALYYLQTWGAFIGGMVLATYTMSIWPEMTDRLSLCPPVRSMLIVIVTYLVQMFFSVWTVAYNFVPGGVYTREHTDYLIVMVMLGLYLGLFVGQKNLPSHTANTEVNNNKMPSTKTLFVLLFLCTFGLSGFLYRYNAQPQHKKHSLIRERVITSMIFTYHFGYDNQGWPSLERTATLINNTGADVITLLESDASKPFLGNNDLGMWLSEKLGLYCDFGPSTRDHTWGVLILSKYPFVKSTHHLLPSPEGELAPAITATVNISGHLVDFVVTHMGNDRDVLDRKLQSKYLAKELKNCENPVLFLGYVTSAPGSKEYKTLIKSGNVKDIDEDDPARWCEYIMYRGLRRLGFARISHGGLSDTEVQLGRFEIPLEKDFKDNDKVTTKKHQVDKTLHFNEIFGNYAPGHGRSKRNRFHMWTPKYFLP